VKKHLFPGKENKEENRAEEVRTGTLDLSIYPKDDNGNLIVPDEVFDKHTKELPDGTYNASKTYRAYNGGRLYQIGSDPVRDAEITKAGADASNATQAHRKTMAETIDILLKKPAKPEILESLGLPDGTDNQTAALVAMVLQMQAGDTKAANFLRDTVGEKPVDRQEIDANIMTEADKALLDKVSKRLESE